MHIAIRILTYSIILTSSVQFTNVILNTYWIIGDIHPGIINRIYGSYKTANKRWIEGVAI